MGQYENPSRREGGPYGGSGRDDDWQNGPRYGSGESGSNYGGLRSESRRHEDRGSRDWGRSQGMGGGGYGESQGRFGESGYGGYGESSSRSQGGYGGYGGGQGGNGGQGS